MESVDVMNHKGGCFVTLMATLAVGALPVPSFSQDELGIRPETRDRAMEQIGLVTREFTKLGEWSSQTEMIESFIRDVWRENHWDTEADRFAKDTMLQVSRIPPWRFEERMDKLIDRFSDRYELSPQQKVRFRSKLYRETFGLILRNAPMMANQTREYVSTRLDARPFTTEQVARWTIESEDLVADSFKRMDRISEALERDMSPEQRAILQRDFRSHERRKKYLLEQRSKWAKGQWRPEDWGLRNDPIQAGRVTQAEGTAGGGLPSDRPVRGNAPATGSLDRTPHKPDNRCVPEDESTWAQYVRQFIEKHRLAAGQRKAVESILAEMVARARDYRQAHAEELDAIAASRRAAAPEFDPIRDMFGELQARAEALLTTTQQSDDHG